MKKNVNGPAAWIPEENGYERTSSPDLIRQVLITTMKKRRLLTLLAGKYQSGATVFISIDSTTLTIDKPVTWPALKKVRIVFKDEAKVWNHVTVSVIEVGKDTVKTKFPTELFRLQRRAHFRITPPSGSTLSFLTKSGDPVEDVVIKDIGSGGVMICFDQSSFPAVEERDLLSEIEIFLLPPGPRPDGSQKDPETFYVAQGVCVRTCIDEKTLKKCLGVEFKAEPVEEMKLTQFIRVLELDELRKGLTEQ